MKSNMKSFNQFINESPIRAMAIDKRLIYDKSLYLGMGRAIPGGGVYYPVMQYKNMSPDPEVMVAKVTDQGDKKKITYIDTWAHVKSSFVNDFREVLSQVRKDVGKI